MRRCGTSKTYSRTRENASSRSFDEMISGKAAPAKATSAHTKWGRTNFVAVRDNDNPKKEALKVSKGVPNLPEDPFSFDTDEKGKTSPTKSLHIPNPFDSQRNSTRLPASRIVTEEGQGQSLASSASPNTKSDSSQMLCAIARPGRTYTRSKDGRVKSSPSSHSQCLLDQFIDIRSVVKSGSMSPHKPVFTQPISSRYTFTSPSTLETSPRKFTAESNSTFFSNDDDDFRSAAFRKRPAMSYTGEMHASAGGTPESYPSKRLKTEASYTSLGNMRTNYSALSFSRQHGWENEEVHKRVQPSSGFPSSSSMFNKEVSKSHSRSFFDNQFGISDKNNKIKCDSYGFESRKSDSDKPRCTSKSLFQKEKMAASTDYEITASSSFSSKYFKGSQETGLTTISSPRTMHFDERIVNCASTSSFSLKNQGDEHTSTILRGKPSELLIKESSHPLSSKKSAVSSSGLNKISETATTTSTVGKRSESSRNKSSESSSSMNKIIETSSIRNKSSETSSSKNKRSESSNSLSKRSESNSSINKRSEGSINKRSESSSSKYKRGETSRIQSGTKQYRIFKSRRPVQTLPEEPVTEDQDIFSVSSPSMPELTLELPSSHESIEDDWEEQNPPDITLTEKTETVSKISSELSQVSQKDSLSANGSQVTCAQDHSKNHSGRVDFESISDCSAFHEEHSDSQKTLSLSGDSQELSQELSSTTENSQKEDVPAAPRRFFKSRKQSSASSIQQKVSLKKSKASYNARSWHQDEQTPTKENDSLQAAAPTSGVKRPFPFLDDEFSSNSPKDSRLIRTVQWPKDRDQDAYTSVRVNKGQEKLYKVVQNVKMAYEVQESGETQDFMDDVEYLLANLKDDQSISIRSLSTIQLAGKCISPAFRMHLRAHGTVTKIFSLLHDACSYPSLALSTAAMMFMLSQDRLNMDLDKESLNLMLKLNEVDIPRSRRNGEVYEGEEAEEDVENLEDSGELEKCRNRVQDLLVQLQKETGTRHIDLEFISTGNLAMESLLSLTSRRAGEWFKEELRALGGLDHFVETIHHCVSSMRGELAYNLEKHTPCLKRLGRCLRVLENITFMNSDNQAYVAAYNKGLLVSATGSILQQCVECLVIIPLQEAASDVALKEQTGWIVFDCLLSVLKVLLNITHDCEFGCTKVGNKEGLLQTVLQCVTTTQWCVPSDQRFDLLVLSLGLLINLMEHCVVNRRRLMDTTVTTQWCEDDDPTEMDAVQALVQLFEQRESAAKQMEEAQETSAKENHSLNNSGQWHETDTGIEWIARSAEKVKEAEKQQKEAAGDASRKAGVWSDGDKSVNGANVGDDDETFTKALHKAGKHMENSIIASYVGLLLGCLIQDNRKYVDIVREHLYDGSFDPMIKILKKFLGFMNLTTAIGATDANSIQRVIDTLEAC